MIGQISQTGKYIAVTGGPGSNYVNNSNYMSVGQLQYNFNIQRLEVYNGSTWQPFNMGTYYVGLNPDSESIIDWARTKMYEERELEKLSAEHPAIKDLVEQIKQKEDQIKMVKNLIKKENDWANESDTVQAGP
jgi:hypothetical protein